MSRPSATLLALVLAMIDGFYGNSVTFVGGQSAELTWGIQSSCAGCSHVVGHVAEYTDREVLTAECSCAAGEGGCTCASEFRWFWNLQCAGNVTMRLENGCGGEAVWHMVAGNISNEKLMVDAQGKCGLGGACAASLGPNLWSTRLVEVGITMPPACPKEQKAVWELPISSDLKCTSVEEIKQRIERVDAPQLVTVVLMFILGSCAGVFICRRNRRPTFEEKPSRYFHRLEKEGDGVEMEPTERGTLKTNGQY